MTSAYSYEFKKGKLVQPLLREARTSQLNHCVYRELLADEDKHGPVDVHKLFTGPIHNPMFEIVEQHTYSLLLTRRSQPEWGGLCKYFMVNLYEYCGYCREEHADVVRRERNEAEEAGDKEVEDLLRSVGRNKDSGKNIGIKNGASNVSGCFGSGDRECSKKCCCSCSRLQKRH